jgi:EmrB/QacA subfamily drug resistance transporter
MQDIVNTESTHPDKPDTKKIKLVVTAVAIGTFMSALDSSVVNIALPKIQEHYNAPLSIIQWVVMSYLLFISSLLVTYGRLGDMYGHKEIYIRGFYIFTAGSLFCGLAPSIIILILARIVQAIGAGMMMAMGPAIITDITPAKERGKYLGFNAISVSVALTTGPVLGGFLTSALGWQSIFYINIPVGIFGIYFASKVIHQSDAVERQKFDIKGTVLIFTSLISILLPLSYTENYGLTNPYIIAAIIGGLFLMGLFVYVEQRIDSPMMDLTLFKNRLFSMSNLSALLNYMAQFSVTLLMPFYLQQLRGLSPSQAGLLMIPMPLTTMVIAPISGILSDKVDSRYTGAIGMSILSLGIFLLSRLQYDTPNFFIILSMMTVGLGSGLFQTPNNSAIMGSVPGNRRGIASSILATMRNIGMVLGIAISGAIFNSHRSYLTSSLAAIGIKGEQLIIEAFTGAINLSYTVGAILASIAVITSLIKGSTRTKAHE